MCVLGMIDGASAILAYLVASKGLSDIEISPNAMMI
jgi:hypothetical protein